MRASCGAEFAGADGGHPYASRSNDTPVRLAKVCKPLKTGQRSSPRTRGATTLRPGGFACKRTIRLPPPCRLVTDSNAAEAAG
jgi:hypothetical protein